MPNIKSKKKHMRKTAKRNAYNRAIKSRINTNGRKFLQAIQEKSLDSAKSLLHMFYQLVDKAVGKKVLKRNTGARQKSKWAKMLNKASETK